MKKQFNFKIFLLVHFIFINFQIKSQQNIILNDEFENNKNNWSIVSNTTHEFNIKEGMYYIEGKHEQKAITTTIAIDTLYENFEISAEFSKLSGIDNNGYGLVWGSENENNEFEFIISGNGQFKIVEWKNAQQNDIISWSHSSYINKWNFATNKLSIKSENNIWKFFINNNYVARCIKRNFFGKKIGFIVNEKIKFKVNYFKLKKSNNTKVETYKSSIINPKIIDISFKSSKNKSYINYGESAVLKLSIKNLNQFKLENLCLKIVPISNVDGLMFNDITIIDSISKNNTKQVSILVKADNNIKTIKRTLEINLMDIDNKLLVSHQINFNTVGNDFYKEQTKKTNNENITKYKNKKSTNNSDGCFTGCAVTSLLVLVLGLIIKIL